ncbi:MAG: cobalt ECF transporter T component CbiQ [Chloroflexota bacterium]
MKLGLDEYAYLTSPIHSWEPRAKLIGLLVLIFAFATVQSLWLIPLMMAVTVALLWLSRLPFSYVRNRLKVPGIFILFLAIMLPFVSGDTILVQVGPLALRLEGTQAMVLIASRFVCILTVSLILFGTAPFLSTIKALRGMGLPSILADMILLTYRYLFELAEMLATMRTAIRMRGFDGSKLNRRMLGTLASLIGSMLVRSYEQAEQVYKAMILRGYGSGSLSPGEFHTSPLDWLKSALAVGTACLLVIMQVWSNL